MRVVIALLLSLIIGSPVLADIMGGGGGSGGGTPGGTSGQVQYNNAGVLGGFTASGGATINTSTGVVTLGNPSSSTLGGVQSAATQTHKWINGINTSGVPSLTQPAFTDVSGNQALSQVPTAQTMPMQCRLYLSSGAPTADVVDDTTDFYVGPYGGGNIVSLPDAATGNVYTQLQLSEISTAIPSAVFRIYDVFLYNNSGSPAVATTAWDSGGQTTGTITGVSAANPAVVTASNSLSAGQLVGIAGITGTMGTASNGLNGRVFKVASANSTTFTLETGINTTGLTYTSGGTFYVIPTSRTTGLTYQNGEYLQTGNLNYVYIGTLMAGSQGTSGRADDNMSSRLVWNYFNRLSKYLLATNSAGSTYTYSTATLRPSANSTVVGTTRVETLVGVVEEPFSQAGVQYQCSNSTTGQGGMQGIGINTILTNAAPTLAAYRAIVANYTEIASSDWGNTIVPPLGYGACQLIEEGDGTSTETWYPGGGYLSGSITGNIMRLGGKF